MGFLANHLSSIFFFLKFIPEQALIVTILFVAQNCLRKFYMLTLQLWIVCDLVTLAVSFKYMLLVH